MEEDKNINILKDIAEIISEDATHNVKVQVAWDGVTVFLDYDPNEEYKERVVVPVFYDAIDEFAYIPQKQLIELYKEEDYGIDSEEIELIGKIMKYFENNKEAIGAICDSFSQSSREATKDEESKSTMSFIL